MILLSMGLLGFGVADLVRWSLEQASLGRLLRFPEIRSDAGRPGPDAVTEYFLIGTFVSLLIASLLAIVVLAAA